MKCDVTNCNREAITFHGVTIATHGYCEEHRCCAVCGLWIKMCKCSKGHTERPDYLEYLKNKMRKECIAKLQLM
jgi:hypothetical protein